MEIQEKIKKEIIQVFEDEFNYKCSIDNINIDQTPKNFDGFKTKGQSDYMNFSGGRMQRDKNDQFKYRSLRIMSLMIESLNLKNIL